MIYVQKRDRKKGLSQPILINSGFKGLYQKRLILIITTFDELTPPSGCIIMSVLAFPSESAVILLRMVVSAG